ncbi:uncharacterized protein EV154DRAFT_494816 [Mucor mucedo]|uniref:uncharacterized protein n=1 Tax=Mucor mucedo TaxID=29922 RepID=UPI00221EAA69|nr:uncharacterized protein EV154DRAFT_494816 [Mucor mucedo]KAI7895749.1 hypothetical protein EV154DRAFT_494816 [Mucor mucedo]
MECGETSKTLYKIVEYNDTLYQIPSRTIDDQQVILLNDVRALVPDATAFLSHTTTLIPFLLDPISHTELIPLRVAIDRDDDSIWHIKVPPLPPLAFSQTNLQTKMDLLVQKFDRILALQGEEEEDIHHSANIEPSILMNNPSSSSTSSSSSNTTTTTATAEPIATTTTTTTATVTQEEEEEPQQQDPPPAFSTPSHAPSSSSSTHRHEAPPSYETSVLSTIKAINSKLCLYESHISNRHKSPRWLSKRDEWIARVPTSIEEVAYQLVQLEMALLWTAVSEAWIQERETWLTLVANARSERHLAGAIINLERHTLVMDDQWPQQRERWMSALLEMLVLPLSH